MLEMIQGLPKAELHLHIEGSLEPELLFKLAQRNGINLPYQSVEDIKAAYQFSDLQSFLDIYYQGAQVLVTEQDFYDLTMAYIHRCIEENIKHTEIFFDPQTHTSRGIAFSTVINGIDKALQEGEKMGVSSYLIMCFLRHLTEQEAFDTLAQAQPYKDKIIAVGLDSSELGHPPEKFKNVFSLAIEQGYLTVAHAGEEGPIEYIEQALDLLKIKRIDHGVKIVDSAELMNRVKIEQIPLTVCPLSNIKLCVFDNLSQHNLKTLIDNGLCTTINSDDPAYFGGYLNQNYYETAIALQLKKSCLIQLAKNSFNASFLPNEKKAAYLSMIDDYIKNKAFQEC